MVDLLYECFLGLHSTSHLSSAILICPNITHLVYLLSFLILQFINYSALSGIHVISPDLPFEHVCFLPPSPPPFFSSFFLLLFKFGDFVPIITFSLPPPLTHPLNKQGYAFIITSWKHSLLIRMAMHSYPQCLNCLPLVGILPLKNASTSVLFSSVTRRLKEFLQDLLFTFLKLIVPCCLASVIASLFCV